MRSRGALRTGQKKQERTLPHAINDDHPVREKGLRITNGNHNLSDSANLSKYSAKSTIDLISIKTYYRLVILYLPFW